MESRNDVEGRAARGAALLDAKRPGWAASIDCDRIALRKCDRCILGQVYGGYSLGCWHIDIYPQSARARAHGFMPYGVTGKTDDSALLADAWRAEVRKRTEVTK